MPGRLRSRKNLHFLGKIKHLFFTIGMVVGKIPNEICCGAAFFEFQLDIGFAIENEV